jgi:hypothetical protein
MDTLKAAHLVPSFSIGCLHAQKEQAAGEEVCTAFVGRLEQIESAASVEQTLERASVRRFELASRAVNKAFETAPVFSITHAEDSRAMLSI